VVYENRKGFKVVDEVIKIEMNLIKLLLISYYKTKDL